MKVLLVATNREKSPFAVTPVGVLAVAGAALANGIEVRVADMMFENDPLARLDAELSANSWDAVAFGIRNLDNCFYAAPRSFHADVSDLVSAARERTRAPLILGGSGFSVEPRGWLSRTDVDYGVVGEGEVAFVRLLKCIEAGVAPRGLPGIVERSRMDEPEYRNGNGVQGIPTSFVDDIKTLGLPAHHLIDYKPYEDAGAFVSIQAKRGCPFRCTYCVYPQLEGSTYRNRTVAHIVDEVESVIESQGVRHFFFSDSVFNTPHRHTLDLCQEMIRRKTPARWMAYVNPVAFDDELAEAMVASGCIGVEFGLDAATEKMLANWEKPFDQTDIRRSLAACEKAGLPFAVHFLFGGPGETWDDIEETHAFMQSCATPAAVFASLGVRIYPGAPIARQAAEEGVIREGQDLFFPTWYVSPHLGENPMPKLDAIARRSDEWSTPTDWESVEMKRIQDGLNRRRARPQWLTASDYGRYIRSKPVNLGLAPGYRRDRSGRGAKERA